MAKYMIQMDDGSQFEVESNNPDGPTNAEVNRAIYGGEKPANPVASFAKQAASSFNRGGLDTADMVTSLIRAPVNSAADALGSDYRLNRPSEALGPHVAPQFMDEGIAKDVADTVGMLPWVAGSAAAVTGRNLSKVPGAVAEFLGIGTSAPSMAAASMPIKREMATGARPDKRVRAEMSLLRGRGDMDAYGYKFDEYGNIVKDSAQKKAVKDFRIPENKITQFFW